MRNGAFMMPAGLGIQDAGCIAILGALGLDRSVPIVLDAVAE